MREEDLIKELENLKIPEIEIKSHKKRLKAALLSSEYFQRPDFFRIFKKSIVFTAPILSLIIVLGFFVIKPELNEANALKLARNNPEIKRLLEEKNMVLGDVKVSGDKAYVLLNQAQTELIGQEIIALKFEEEGEQNIEGAIIEVDIKKREIVKIAPIEGKDVFLLKAQDKEIAKEIVDSELMLKEIIPREAKIEKIQSSLPKKLSLIKEDGNIRAVLHPESKKEANVYYVFDGKKWVVQVNLTERKVKEIKYSFGNINSKGRK